MVTSTTHKEASKIYYNIAKDKEKEMDREEDINKKTALRMVSGQNYFYAGIEAIETILKENGITVIDHKDRILKIETNYRLFKNADELLIKHKLVTQEGLNYRRLVAYRGEDGNKFITLKDFAKKAMEEINYNDAANEKIEEDKSKGRKKGEVQESN